MVLNVDHCEVPVTGLLEGPGAGLLAASARGGLLLDLDGTLVDSEAVHAAAYREYFSSRGWGVGEDVIREFSGRQAPDVFATLAGPWSGEDPIALTQGVLDALGGTTLQSVPVAGAARLLAACLQGGPPVAIVTSAPRYWVSSALDLLGLGGTTVPMVTAEDCSPGKPDPEPFHRGAELLGLRAADLVVAEDSPAGIASARGAGIGHVIGITTSRSDASLLAAGAHATAPDLVALADLVEKLSLVENLEFRRLGI